jgi:hypothetical protein
VKRLVAVVLGLLVVAGVLLVLAAAYEVRSLAGSLARVAGEFRVTPTLPRLGPDGARSQPQPDAGPGPGPGVATSVRFTVSASDLNALLGRSRARLGGTLVDGRDVSSRLTTGRILLETRTWVRAFGVPVVDYSAFSDWSLAALPDGLGIRLNDLRVAGIPVVMVPWLIMRLAPTSRDDWIVVRTGSRHVLQQLDIGEGRLTIEGTLRRRSP